MDSTLKSSIDFCFFGLAVSGPCSAFHIFQPRTGYRLKASWNPWVFPEELSDLLACSDRHQKLDLKATGDGRLVTWNMATTKSEM